MRTLCLLLMTTVCGTALAQAPPAEPVPAVQPFTAPGVMPELNTEPAWIQRMDRADRLYRTGARMGTIGAPVMLTGIVMALIGIDRGNVGIGATGLLIAMGGGVSLSYGGPVMLVGAMQMTTAAEMALQQPLPRGNVVGGWVSFALIGGLPSYAFAAAQRRLVLTALHQSGRMPITDLRLHPTPSGLVLSGRF